MIYFYSLILMGSFVSDAYAYLDPGTGSLFIQSTIASIAGGIFIIKNYYRVFWAKLSSKLFSNSKNKVEQE